MLDSLFSFPGDLSSKLLLKRIDNRDVESSTFAIGQEGEQDISRAVSLPGRSIVSFSSASRLWFFSSTLVTDFLSSEVPLASWHRLSTGSGSSSHENKSFVI